MLNTEVKQREWRAALPVATRTRSGKRTGGRPKPGMTKTLIHIDAAFIGSHCCAHSSSARRTQFLFRRHGMPTCVCPYVMAPEPTDLGPNLTHDGHDMSTARPAQPFTDERSCRRAASMIVVQPRLIAALPLSAARPKLCCGYLIDETLVIPWRKREAALRSACLWVRRPGSDWYDRLQHKLSCDAAVSALSPPPCSWSPR